MNKVHLETRMSTSYLAKLERDEFLPGPQNLKKIVRALKALDVADAEELNEEYEAMRREREVLANIEQLLKEIDDAEARSELLDGLLTRLNRLRDRQQEPPAARR